MIRRLLLAMVVISATAAQAQPKPAEVTFQSDGLELHGFLWRPDGDGPFPAILWNHGSEKLPGSQADLAAFYTAHHFVFFIPHRRGQGRSPGTYIQDLIAASPPGERPQRMVELQDAEADDVTAALAFLKAQPFVDDTRVAVSGCSYGGIQTLLAGERNRGIAALVAFAPGAMSWNADVPLQMRLARAVMNIRAPALILQAQNDFTTAPSQVLGQQALDAQVNLHAKIYPAYGQSHQDGHFPFCTKGMNVWGDDVLAFLDASLHIQH